MAYHVADNRCGSQIDDQFVQILNRGIAVVANRLRIAVDEIAEWI